MPKFNLKNYKPSDGDAHLNKQLADEPRAKIPEEITEKQLDSHRAAQPEQITEKQLDAVRKDNEALLPEARLDNEKPHFDVKYRNSDAHNGDINKLEEQRVGKKNRNETETYEASSKPAKDRRWWENKDGNENLKIAKKTASLKDILKKMAEDVAHGEEEEPSGNDQDTELHEKYDRGVRKTLDKMWPEMETGVDESTGETSEIMGTADESGSPVVKSAPEISSLKMPDREVWLVDSKEGVAGDKSSQFPGALGDLPYTSKTTIGFDPMEWPSLPEARKAALEKILEVRPDLDGKISMEDIPKHPRYVGDRGFLTLSLIGDEYRPEAASTESQFTEDDFGQTDAGGTPVFTGKVTFKADDDIADRETLASDVAEYLNELHPELNITSDALDIDLQAGTVTYAIAAGGDNQWQRISSPDDGAEGVPEGAVDEFTIDETEPALGEPAEEGEPTVEPEMELPAVNEESLNDEPPALPPEEEQVSFPIEEEHEVKLPEQFPVLDEDDEEKPVLPPASAARNAPVVTSKKK